MSDKPLSESAARAVRNRAEYRESIDKILDRGGVVSDALLGDGTRPNDKGNGAWPAMPAILEWVGAERYGLPTLWIGGTRLETVEVHRAGDSKPVAVPVSGFGFRLSASGEFETWDAEVFKTSMGWGSRFREYQPPVFRYSSGRADFSKDSIASLTQKLSSDDFLSGHLPRATWDELRRIRDLIGSDGETLTANGAALRLFLPSRAADVERYNAARRAEREKVEREKKERAEKERAELESLAASRWEQIQNASKARKWSRGRVTIKLRGKGGDFQPVDVEAYTLKGSTLALTRNDEHSQWCVTHVPTGARLAGAFPLTKAKIAGHLMLLWGDWPDEKSPEKVSEWAKKLGDISGYRADVEDVGEHGARALKQRWHERWAHNGIVVNVAPKPAQTEKAPDPEEKKRADDATSAAKAYRDAKAAEEQAADAHKRAREALEAAREALIALAKKSGGKLDVDGLSVNEEDNPERDVPAAPAHKTGGGKRWTVKENEAKK